jgi:uncharacterized protein (TIGR00106 family)
MTGLDVLVGTARFLQEAGPAAEPDPAMIPGMRVIADVCVVPVGVGVSVSEYIAACERVFADFEVETALHAYGTNVEGEWDEVFAAVKRCHEVVHEMGAPRISTTMKFGTRTDREQSMADKVTSVQSKLAAE